MNEHRYSVYMMQSTSRHVLYIGMTSNLRHRVWQHKNGTYEGFTAQYKCHRLVYFETHQDVHRALRREKQLKGWRREKKEALITKYNPHWKDLAGDWYPETQDPSLAITISDFKRKD